MGKFDRCIFISIAIGIWAFVLTQFLEPNKLNAHGSEHEHESHLHFAALLPDFKKMVTSTVMRQCKALEHGFIHCQN